MLEVAEEAEPLLECREAQPRLFLGGERIELPLGVHAHRGHLSDRGVEGARLAAGRIVGMVDACGRQRVPSVRTAIAGSAAAREDEHPGAAEDQQRPPPFPVRWEGSAAARDGRCAHGNSPDAP